MLPAHANPYRASRLDRLRFHFPPGWDMDRLLARLDALGGRAAIVGRRGSGKTTLLRELARALGGRGLEVHLVRIGHRNDPPLPPLLAGRRPGPGDAVLVDAGEELRAAGWRRVRRATRTAGVLVVTAHRPGRLPTLIELAPTPDLLRHILAELDPTWATAPDDLLAALLDENGNDLHRVLLALYDLAGTAHHPSAAGREAPWSSGVSSTRPLDVPRA
ncbi:MAG TPA: hypothetical protein ENK19_03550 [Acidobacteria bacterium]|nr:hypothetical protein [Acidobacteriota bacterium]